jgi:Protein of unknown function (DUF2975)
MNAGQTTTRLAKLCRVVRAMSLLGALLLVAVTLWSWISPEFALKWAAEYAIAGAAPVTLSERAHRLGALVTLLPMAIGLIALLHLWRLFGDYARGLALTGRAQDHLRRFAFTLLAGAVLQPLYRAALSVIATMDNPPGQRMLIIKLSSDDYLLLLLGLVLLAIAMAMSDAVRAVEENRGFV